MSDNIPPFDIQMEIIKRVTDVKPLLRFRAVSKPWKSYIDSSQFIAGYGARDTQPHTLLLRYKDSEFACWDHLFLEDDDNDDDADDETFPEFIEEFASNVPLYLKQIKYLHVIGTSCGLWSFHSNYEAMLFIWNPSIRKSVGIVVPNKMTEFGFGVCPSTYDPTIVGMSFQTDRTNKETISSVGIFTLSSKTWKMLPTSNLPRESIEFQSLTPVTIGRFIYWDVWDRTVAKEGLFNIKRLILSFDLITHEFKEVYLSDSIAKQAPRHISMSKLNESLVYCGIINEVNDELVYSLWMMGDEGAAMPSFTKLFNIKIPDSSMMTLLGFRKNGEPIIQTVEEDAEFGALEVYEPCSEHMNNLEIYGENDSFFICPYKESLLLADHSDGCIISNDY